MFLRVQLSEFPMKKKAAVGVRGIKLSPGDEVSDVYLIESTDEMTVEHKGHEIVLNRLHFAHRDTKGVKK